ncbi:MAG: hypothetical protein HPY68_07165 [Candidatus Atribacteria bacterium]|nr:hypothetical protein [Candidatus Atribacteria bacterium]
MKKNLWFVFVALAMVAIFTVAGCTPSTPTPSPTATPTVAPTVAPDTACPKVVSTVVSKAYSVGGSYNFKIVITFDEPVELSACAEDPANWTVTVSNSKRDYYAPGADPISADVVDVEADGKKVVLYASVYENVSYDVIYYDGNGNLGRDTFKYEFPGLICSEADAEAYATGYEEGEGWSDSNVVVSSSVSAPTVADVVSWKLTGGCFIYDELGNGCCSFSGEDCCLEPVCEECVEECPLGSGICQ